MSSIMTLTWPRCNDPHNDVSWSTTVPKQMSHRVVLLHHWGCKRSSKITEPNPPSCPTRWTEQGFSALSPASSDHTITQFCWLVAERVGGWTRFTLSSLVCVDASGAVSTYTDCRSLFCCSPLVLLWHGSSSAYFPGLQLVPSTSEAFHFQK